MHNELIRSIFKKAEIEKIKNTGIKDRRHPLKRLLFPQDKDLQVVLNTERSLKYVLKTNPKWLPSIKPRLLDIADYSSSSSALGEIRTYGYLLEASLVVKSIHVTSTGTQDFVIEENKEKIRVEVHCKQFHELESKALEKFHSENAVPRKNQKYTIKEHVVTPFNKPRRSENVTENAISKLAQIKQNELQLNNNETSILWLDFQDEIWNLALHIDSTQPVRTWNGEFFSGEIWYAFYGWKGAPIFEGHTTEQRIRVPHVIMRHEGRFRGKTKLDAVIISFPRNTIILENPYSKKPIKQWLWRKLILIPWFSLKCSYANWPNTNLKRKIVAQKNMIISLSHEAIYGW